MEKILFINKSCKYYPCHAIDKKNWVDCCHCYCPLYLLKCAGKFAIVYNSMKDCTDCHIPHIKGGWEYIQKELQKQLFTES